MRFRLLALIVLVLGLSRLAFPATNAAASHRSRAHSAKTSAKRTRAGKVRPKPVRRAVPPPVRHQQSTPVLPAPEIQLSSKAFDTPPIPAFAQLSAVVVNVAKPVKKLFRMQPASARSAEMAKIIRQNYWTAEQAAASAMAVPAAAATIRVALLSHHDWQLEHRNAHIAMERSTPAFRLSVRI